ncbi:MAG: tetratricopeptide repeat protein, partial [bacterium]|nr:tetratricopeptide repeat protein [bacterium]
MADLDLRRLRMLWLLGLVVMAGMLSVSAEAQDKSDPGLDLYYNANSLCHRRFYKQAIDEYKRFLTKYPNHAKVPRAKWGMAISLYNLDRLKAAQPLLSELVGNAEITAQDKVHNLLGSCLLELGKHAEAEKAFAWTIANAKDAKGKLTTNARVGLVEALYLQKKWGELVKASDSLLDSAPESSHADNARFQGAVARSKQGQHDEAAAVFEKIIAASKDAKLVHRATFRLAECKQLTGKLAQAAAMYAKVAKTSKGVYSEYAQYDLGVVYFLQKDYKKAIDELLGFNKLYPKSTLGPQARLHLGRAYLETKNYAQAAACLKKLIAKTSTVRAPAVLWLARTYSRQNSNATVESMLTPVIESFAGTPELPGMLNELATAQMRMKKFPAAAAMFGRARGVSKPPQSTEFLRLQAFCLNQAGQHDESIKLTDAFLKLDSAQASKLEVMFIKADNLMMLKKPAEALAVYTKILAVDPKHARASQMHFRIAQVHVGSKQWAQAAQHLTALLAGDNSGKTFKQASFMLGNCYFNMKKWTEAIAAFEMFLDKQYAEDNADTALYNLALACERNKLKSKAIAIFREMVTKNSYARRDDAGVAIKPEKPKPQDKQKLNNTIAKRRHHQKAYVELGRLLYEAGQYPEAATHLTAAINGYRSTKEKGDGNAEYYLGWVYLKENKLKEAAGCFAKVATFPAHPFAQDAALQCAILHIRNKDVKSAQVALKKMMSGPNPIKADQGAYYLGLAMARQEDLPKPKSNEKRYAAALANFETVLTKYPKSDKVPNALYWKGKCIEKLPARGGPAKAAVIYADFLKKYPTNKLVPDVTVDM